MINYPIYTFTPCSAVASSSLPSSRPPPRLTWHIIKVRFRQSKQLFDRVQHDAYEVIDAGDPVQVSEEYAAIANGNRGNTDPQARPP